jgi:hypothetical protein
MGLELALGVIPEVVQLGPNPPGVGSAHVANGKVFLRHE